MKSPCIRLCELDTENTCIGCGRTVGEIAEWMKMDNRRKGETARLARTRMLERADRARGGLCRSSTNGFTVVELLVSIAITGVLASLLLPAIQSARETARKMTCQSHLRQLGVALHSYHQTYQTLPPGCMEWRGFRAPTTHRQYAWSAFILPFIERQTLHQRIDFSVPFDAPRNAEAARTRISIYECPSSPTRYLSRGQSDYGGLYGELMVDREPDDGVLVYERAFAFHDILDGLSQTLAVSEDVGGPDSEWINGRNVFVQSGGINDPSAWKGDNEIRSLHGAGAMALYIDSHVDFLSNSIDKIVLGSLITRSKSEVIPGEF